MDIAERSINILFQDLSKFDYKDYGENFKVAQIDIPLDYIRNANQDSFIEELHNKKPLSFHQFKTNFNHFYLLTNCNIPKFMAIQKSSKSNLYQQSKESYEKQYISIDIIFEHIITKQQENKNLVKFLDFKDCLYKEFSNDVAFINFTSLISNQIYGLYFKTLRSTYEHKIISIIEIRSHNLVEFILDKDL